MMETTETSKSVTDLRGIKNKKTRRSVESILDPDDLKKPAPDLTVRMLLIFAPDGAAEAENIVTGTLDFRVPELPHIRVDMMRLNEVRSIKAAIKMSLLSTTGGAVEHAAPEPRGVSDQVAGRGELMTVMAHET